MVRLLASLALGSLAALPCPAQYQENFESWPQGTVNPLPWQSLGLFQPPTVTPGLNHTGLALPWPHPFLGQTGQQALVAQLPPGPSTAEIRLDVPPAPTTGSLRYELSVLYPPGYRGLIEIEMVALTLQGIEPVARYTINADASPDPDLTTSQHLVAGIVVKSATFLTQPGDWLSVMGEIGPTCRECVHTATQTIWYTSLGRPSDPVAATVRITNAPTSPGGFIAIDDVAVTNHSSVCMADLTSTAVPGAPGYAMPNGVLNNDDFFYFLAQFAAGNTLVCDMTTSAIPGAPAYGIANGVITNDDFFFYLQLFAQGCPA